MKQWILNPFTYIAGTRALIAGLAIMVVTAVIARYSHTHFDGVLDVHIGGITPVAAYAIEPLIDWLVSVVVFQVAGSLFSTTRPRLIDTAGTLALSRAPLLLAAVAAFAQPADVSIEHMPPGAWVVAVVVLLCAIPMIALMYNAFRVSANIKGSRAGITFTIALIIAEIISKLAFYFIYPTL